MATETPTIVLVHGAWADASGWNDVIKKLQRDGYPVIAPANPLRLREADLAHHLSNDGANDGASVTTQAAGAAPDATVLEHGLTSVGDTTETTTGTFTVSASDGILNVVIGGTTFTLAEVQAFNGTQTVLRVANKPVVNYEMSLKQRLLSWISAFPRR